MSKKDEKKINKKGSRSQEKGHVNQPHQKHANQIHVKTHMAVSKSQINENSNQLQ